MDSGEGAEALPPARCRIRASPDHSRLAAPRGLSQPTTPFVGSWRQGIPRTPFLAPRPLPRRRATRRILRSSIKLCTCSGTGPSPGLTLRLLGPSGAATSPSRHRSARRAQRGHKNRPRVPAGRLPPGTARAYGSVSRFTLRLAPRSPRLPAALGQYTRERWACARGGAGEIRTPDLPRARRALSH